MSVVAFSEASPEFFSNMPKEAFRKEFLASLVFLRLLFIRLINCQNLNIANAVWQVMGIIDFCFSSITIVMCCSGTTAFDF